MAIDSEHELEQEVETYHIVSRAVVGGYPLADEDKEFLVSQVFKKLGALFFAEILGYCVMGDHFHLMVRMHPGDGVSDEDIKKRHEKFFGKGTEVTAEEVFHLREKYSSISEFVKEIKQRFTREYNRKKKRTGFFWNSRYKCLIIEKGFPLLDCLAYVELNPVRAGLVTNPESYPWNSVYYRKNQKPRDLFLSYDFGVKIIARMNKKDKYEYYKKYVLEAGGLGRKKEKPDGVYYSRGNSVDRFSDRYKAMINRNRYFSDAFAMGSRDFVREKFHQNRESFATKKEKVPNRVKGLGEVYSLRRLSKM